MPKLNADLIESNLELAQETYDFARSNLRQLYMDCTLAGFKRADVINEKKFESMFNALNERLETLKTLADESVNKIQINRTKNLGQVVIVNNFLRETVGRSYQG